MSLTEEQRRTLRGKAHKLKPVVLLGKAGLTEPVLAEVNSALAFHELIKVKVRDEDREARRATIAELATKCDAELLQVIGQIAVLFRAAPEKQTARPTQPEPRRKRYEPEPRARRTPAPRRSESRSDSRRPESGRFAPPTKSRPSGAGRRRPGPSRKR